MQTFVVHFLLAVLLFFLVNWIGGHAISAGYHRLTIFGQVDEAPAFNTLFRVLTPTVYLLITAAIWYSLGLDLFVLEYWRVALYYVVFRWLFNLVLGRSKLMNWNRQFVLGFLTVGTSFLVYQNLIRYRANLLPDAQNLANEIWLVVLFFLYDTWNRTERSSVHAGSEARRKKFIQDAFNKLQFRFGEVVERNVSLRVVQALSYAVMVYEEFNRPPVYQWIERHVLLRLGWSKTIGPMQVRTEEPVDDTEAVAIGVRKLQRDYEEAVENQYRALNPPKSSTADKPTDALPQPISVTIGAKLDALPPFPRFVVRTNALQRYNIRSDYPGEVDSVFSVIVARFYPDLVNLEFGV